MNISSRVCIGLFLIAHTLVFILAVLASGAAYFHFVYGPTKKFELEVGKFNLLEYCDPTTDAFEDLLLTPDMSVKDAAYIGNTHGVVVVPSMLTKETANELRDLVLGMNAMSTGAEDIHAPENRYHVQPSYKNPIVKKALKEIATHPQFVTMMVEILGPNPSFTFLDAITATYGAKDQNWHWDTDTSSAIYPTEMLAGWALSIALQDTTDEMGATGFCPGTHTCSWVNVPEEEDEDSAQKSVDEICPLTMNVSLGDGFLYMQDTIHKGRAHTDPNAGDRVFLFVGFSESKQGPEDNRIFPLGEIYALNWDMWGQTLDDLATIDERPWRPWHPFGLFNGHKDARPSTIFDAIVQTYVHEEEACYVFKPQFGRFYRKHIQQWVISLMLSVFGLALVLYGVFLPCGLIFSYLVRPLDPVARKVSTANGTKHHAD